ncbi:MAG: NUDIX domain-containing protein [bacterium]|nr:NUDIX domain-containing protein [bacterium]
MGRLWSGDMAWTLQRPAARVVLLDSQSRVFLMRASDPVNPQKLPWWEIPGGGLDPGEDFVDCARRELWEEAGFLDVEMGPCIWTQQVSFEFAGLWFDSSEQIFVAWAKDGGQWAPQRLEMLEAAAFIEARWWSLEELLASKEKVLPERLREFLPDVVAGKLPDAPIDISPVV